MDPETIGIVAGIATIIALLITVGEKVRPRRKKEPVPEPAEQTRSGRREEKVISVADSRLVVVKAILLGWDLESVVGEASYETNYVHHPWSESVLTALDEGHADMAIFNQESTRAYMQARPTTSLEIAGVFGYSMGGRNFCILAHREGRWAKTSADEFLADPSGARICVGVTTDRFQNLLRALGVDAGELAEMSITLVDQPEPTLDIFSHDPDVLVIGGQNTRFEALVSGEYVELVRYESLPNDRRPWFQRSAANALVVRRDLVAELQDEGIDDLFLRLKRAFYASWQDPATLEKRLKMIVRDCEFSITNPADREKVAKHILYETYRIGQPTW